jgi:hypothetical protein
MGGKRQAPAALPPEIYEGHVGETIKQKLVTYAGCVKGFWKY